MTNPRTSGGLTRAESNAKAAMRSVRLVPAVPAYSMLRYVIHLYVGPMCMYAIVCVHARYRMIYDDRCKIV